MIKWRVYENGGSSNIFLKRCRIHMVKFGKENSNIAFAANISTKGVFGNSPASQNFVDSASRCHSTIPGGAVNVRRIAARFGPGVPSFLLFFQYRLSSPEPLIDPPHPESPVDCPHHDGRAAAPPRASSGGPGREEHVLLLL
jgi:hypothetical protein